MKKLNIPPLGQRDARWANQPLGTGGTTIGGYGCLVTSMSMLATFFGHSTTPAEMNTWLTNNSGYVQGNLYRNDALGREFTDLQFDNTVFCTDVPAPISQIKAYIDANKPVVVMVDFDKYTPGIQTHFVLVVGYGDDGALLINDPWYGDQVFFKARYGEDAVGINQINFFSKKASVPQVPMATITQAELDAIRKARDDNYNALQTEKGKTTTLTTQLSTCQTSLTTSNNKVEKIRIICI